MIKTYTLADKAVTTAGTRVQLTATNTYVMAVTIQGNGANTGFIYVGDSSVSATRGVELDAGQAVTLSGTVTQKGTIELLNLADIWLDSSVNAETAHIVYQQQVA